LVAGARPVGLESQLRRGLLCVLILASIWAAVAYANKACGNASAILRWRELIQSVARGENVYNEWTKDGSFPYPPIAGLLLWPITQLPPLTAAITWFCLKLAMVAASIRWSILLVTQPDERFALWQVALLIALATRPILSDLQHGNINILILFLTTAGLVAFRNHRDWLAGAMIGLAGAIKVTPLLFVPYFALKRQWNMVASSLAGLALFLLLVPGTTLGFERNWWLVRSWSGAMIEPYALEGKVETIQTNQSLPGVLVRLTTDSPGIELEDGTRMAVNWVNLQQETALWIVKGLIVALLAWIGWLARNDIVNRRDARLALEYAMIFIAMLLISERSWKHHFVTMILPFAALVAAASRDYGTERMRAFIWVSMAAAFLLMASTSSEVGGWFSGGIGHKLAQAYGMFLASGCVVFVALSVLLGSRTEIKRVACSTPNSESRGRPTLE
jgi:alpha-1,2-mannosyltransferase